MTESVIVERSLECSQVKAWEAITGLDAMRDWFFEEIPEFQPVVGFKTQFSITAESQDFVHQWEVLEVVPEHRIVYDWRYEGLPGTGKVTFELNSSNDTTRVVVTNEGLETFPSEIPEFSRESCESGWNFLLDRLADYIAP